MMLLTNSAKKRFFKDKALSAIIQPWLPLYLRVVTFHSTPDAFSKTGFSGLLGLMNRVEKKKIVLKKIAKS